MTGKPRTCPICDAALEPQMRFCWHCGAGARREFPGSPLPASLSHQMLVVLGVAALMAGTALFVYGSSSVTQAVPGLWLVGLTVAVLGAVLCLAAGRRMADGR